jgi:hypothetical protein
MRIRWYRLAVLALWLVAMSWLVVCKILPPLLIGEPPIYASMAAERARPPVAWYLNLNDIRLGWALSEISRQSTDATEIHSLVHFDGLPLDQLLPVYLRELARASIQSAKRMEMEVESHMLINPLNQLQSFDSKLKFRPHTGQSLVTIEGNVDGDKLKLAFRVGDMPLERMELSMPENKIRDSFSPETELRGLHLGQSWTIVTYSPLALPSNPLDLVQHRAPTEVLLAKVEEKTLVMWNGQMEPAWLVVYRSDASQTPDDERNIRNRMWVRTDSKDGTDGMVIRQQVLLGGNSLLFSRMPEKAAGQLRGERKDFSSQQP